MIHPQILVSGEIVPAEEALFRGGQVGMFAGWGIFSTIRVMEGALFAFDRHWARLQRDADLLRVPFPWAPEELEALLLRLVEANRARAELARDHLRDRWLQNPVSLLQGG